MDKFEKMNKDLVRYFTHRGWENKILFKMETLFPTYFTYNQNRNKKCDWYYTIDKELLNKYTTWVFEHIKPFWIKYNIGECWVNISLKNKEYDVRISYDGEILEFYYPTVF